MTNEMRTVLSVLRDWELLGPEPDLARFFMNDWRAIGKAIEQHYVDFPVQPQLGGIHLGLWDGIRYAEGHLNHTQLAIPLLTSQVLWLPDPFYSLLAQESSKRWAHLPESGSEFFRAQSPRMPWKSLWATPKDGRRSHIRKTLPRLLAVARELEPLAALGAVRFFPWETMSLPAPGAMRDAVEGLIQRPEAIQLQRRFPQDQYTLGPRVGSFGLMVTKDSPDQGLKAGDRMWFAEPRAVFIYALQNLEVCAKTQSSLLPQRPGDRVVFDYVCAGGEPNPTVVELAAMSRFPVLSSATWPDIVAIRGDNESLALLRGLVSEAAQGGGDEAVFGEIKHRVEESAERVRADSSLMKAARGGVTEVSLSAFLSGAAGSAILGSTAGVAAASAAVGGAATYISSLVARLSGTERGQKRRRAQLLFRIADRIGNKK